MGLSSLITRTSGSVGAEKTDANVIPYSNTVLPSGEWNNLAQAGVDVSAEVGLHDGTTSGSLVAKTKEFIRLETHLSGISQFANSNPLPAPFTNNGWLNPTITSSDTSNFPGGKILEIRADGVTSSGYSTAVWWFDKQFPFQSCMIEYNQSLGVSNSLGGASEAMMVGLIFAADTTSGSGLLSVSGFYGGSPQTWMMRLDGPSGYLFYSNSVGSYASKQEFDFFAGHTQGSAPSFLFKYSGNDVLGDTDTKYISSGQIGFLSSAWISGSADKVGIVLFGSASVPITMSLFDTKIYPRPGDPGTPI